MTKINQMQVWIIGAVLVLITALVIFFAMIKPANERLKAANDKYDAQKAIADTMPQAQGDRKKAEKEVAAAKRDWAKYDAALMPNINLSGGLYNAMRQLWKEQIKDLGPRVDTYVKGDKKVQLLQAGFNLPPPPTDPNQVNRKFLVYDLGNIAVMGNFNDVLNNVSRWNRFSRLVLADGLTLSGNSPRLVGQYRITCYEFIRGEAPNETWPVAAGGTGGGRGLGGGGGGYGGGAGAPVLGGGGGPVGGGGYGGGGAPAGAPVGGGYGGFGGGGGKAGGGAPAGGAD